METETPIRLELWLGRCGGLAGLATLAVAIWNMLRSVSRSAGRLDKEQGP